MKIFGIEVEANVRLLNYSESDQFFYEEIDSVQCYDEKFNISLLIQIKQEQAIPEVIDVIVIHIIDSGVTSLDGNGKEQNLRKLHLAEISLNPDSIQAYRPKQTLIRDKWPIKQHIKWNMKGIPSNGTGSYALVLSAPNGDNKEDPLILDCSYFEVR